MESTLEPRNPTISPGNREPAESTISQDSPTEQNGPADSTRLPTTSVTCPVQRMVELLRSQFTYGSRGPGFILGLVFWGRVFAPGGRRSPVRLLSVELPEPCSQCRARFQASMLLAPGWSPPQSAGANGRGNSASKLWHLPDERAQLLACFAAISPALP